MEARDGAGDAVGGAEVEQGGETVGDGAADLVGGSRRPRRGTGAHDTPQRNDPPAELA